MLKARIAKPTEFEALSGIASRSEAYWGYDIEYMEKFDEKYKITEKFIVGNLNLVLEKDKNIVGFYGVISNEIEMSSLEYFFIEPKYIGKGYGKILWNYLVIDCRKNGIKEFSIVTSPQAKEFYLKMGAVYSGDVESLLRKGRMIPMLTYKII